MRNVFIKSVLLIVITAVLLLASYSLINIAFYIRDSTNIKIKTNTSNYNQHPYLTADLKPNLDKDTQDYPVLTDNNNVQHTGSHILKTNSMGFRDREFSKTRPPDLTRICAVGGSSLVGGQKNENTIPALLESLLINAGHKVEVYNFGSPGRASTQEFFLFHTTITDFNCNVLLIYNGRNDAFNGSMPLFKPYWDPWDFRRMEILEGNNNDVPLWEKYFYLLKRIIPKLLFLQPKEERYDTLIYSTLSYTAKDPNHLRHDYKPSFESIVAYQKNLKNMAALAKSYGMKVIIAIQPTIIWSSKKPLHDFEKTITSNLSPSFITSMKQLKGPLIEAARKVASQNNAIFVDLTAAFNDKNHFIFIDDVHTNDLGHKILADILARKIIPELP